RSGDALPPPAEWLETPAESRQKSESGLLDAIAPPCQNGNLFAATNLKLCSSKPYSLQD
ncbi:hypothetical protein S83_004864, partial [Arachis hypogaea]